MSVAVTLSLYEVEAAAMVGVRRQVEALRVGREQRYGQTGDGWADHVRGALAELAVAKHRDRYWNAVVRDPSLLEGDVGRFEVRHTLRRDGHLILHPGDHDDRAYILATGAAPTITLAGWTWGRDGKSAEYWRDAGPNLRHSCFMVPQSALRIIE